MVTVQITLERLQGISLTRINRNFKFVMLLYC